MTKIAQFEDSPEPAELEIFLRKWERLRLPPGLETCTRLSGQEGIINVFHLIRERLDKVKGTRSRNRLEIQLTGWLYDLIRRNVKRGRIFDLRQVLEQGRADCTGYSKLFTLLGRVCGLDAGVVDVVRDNSGRLVPHTAVLVLMSGGRHRFIDLWYGSANIKHQRVGLRVKRRGRWTIADIQSKEIKTYEAIKYLPDSCVDGITHYIIGNGYLNRQAYTQAISHYSKALELYPGNARFYYNRAIAYENLGKNREAEADYERALRNDAALIRVLAIEHEEVTSLIGLDERGIEESAQKMYLLNKGFVTGRKVPPIVIARKFGMSESGVENILSLVEGRLAACSGVE